MCSTDTAAARPWTSSPRGSPGTSSPPCWPRERRRKVSLGRRRRRRRTPCRRRSERPTWPPTTSSSRNTRCVQRTARVTLRTKTHVRFVYRVYYAYMHFRPTLNTSKRFLFVLAMYISSSFWMTMPPCDYLRTLAVSLALFIRKEIKKKER